jgi:protein-L-isoaspartate(D-aspartate) O-methyltransferase
VRITVAAAAPGVPDALAEQLADGGRLVIPVGSRWEQELLLVERHGAALATRDAWPEAGGGRPCAAGWAEAGILRP